MTPPTPSTNDPEIELLITRLLTRPWSLFDHSSELRGQLNSLETPSSFYYPQSLHFISLYLPLYSSLWAQMHALGSTYAIPSDTMLIGCRPCKDNDGNDANQVRLVYLPGAGVEQVVLEGAICKELDDAVESFLEVALEEGRKYTRGLIGEQGDV